MNWYKIAKEREYPVAAVVVASGKVFRGEHHGIATQKAIDDGSAYWDDKGRLRDKKDDTYMAFTGATDLFITNKGRLIDRFDASSMREATGSENIPESEIDTLNKIVKKYEAQGVEIYAYEDGKGAITLSNLRVPKDNRNQGTGSAFMQELCAYADRSKQRIELNLADKEPGGTTSRGRLIEFYKRFGFVRNFGRTKDYTLSCQMYRKPQ